MILDELAAIKNRDTFPRVSGDDPWLVMIFLARSFFSPRKRG